MNVSLKPDEWETVLISLRMVNEEYFNCQDIIDNIDMQVAEYRLSHQWLEAKRYRT